MLNEKSDAYSFGILIMEIISGRCPVDHSRPHGEVSLGHLIWCPKFHPIFTEHFRLSEVDNNYR